MQTLYRTNEFFEYNKRSNSKMLETGKLTDRVKVEIVVKKGLLGYPGSPSQYYLAVVGNGPQLGQDNPTIAPRCKRIGNNVWMKEIWVKKESLVSFNFLIVHGPTNTVFETEHVSERRIFVKGERVQYRARYNETDIKNERDYFEKSQQSAVKENNEVEEAQSTEKDLRQKENKKSTGESKETTVPELDSTRNKERKTREVNLEDVAENIGYGDDRVGNMNKNRKLQRAFIDMGHKIKFEKLLLDLGDLIKVQLGVHKSVLDTYNHCVNAVNVYADRIGLKPDRQSIINITDDISHQQLWVRKDLLETFLTGKNNATFKLRIDEIEPQKTSASTDTKAYTTKQSTVEVLQEDLARQNTKPSLTGHTTSRTDRSLSPITTNLTVDQTHPQSIAKTAGPGSSQPTVNKASLQSSSMSSYDLARQNTKPSLTGHTTSRTDRSLSPIITDLTVDQTHPQSIAKTAGPGSSQPTVNKASLQSSSMSSYEDMPYNTHIKTEVVRHCADVASRHILIDLPDRTTNEALPAALDKPQALPNEMLQRECDTVKEISLELDNTSQLEKTNTGLKTSCTSINIFKDNPRGENTGNNAETQRHLRKSPSTWTLRSCKKGLVLVAVGLGVATCLKAFVFK